VVHLEEQLGADALVVLHVPDRAAGDLERRPDMHEGHGRGEGRQSVACEPGDGRRLERLEGADVQRRLLAEDADAAPNDAGIAARTIGSMRAVSARLPLAS
jgi:hypothetical protein